MTVRELLKRLDDDGWFIDRTRGSHRQLRHPTKPGTVTVSGHLRDDEHEKGSDPKNAKHPAGHLVFGVRPLFERRKIIMDRPLDSQECSAASAAVGRRMTKEYTVIYERGERNWSAYVPDLPGCIATGKDRDDVERRIREAVEFHIQGLKLHGDPVPEPSIEAGQVTVSTPDA